MKRLNLGVFAFIIFTPTLLVAEEPDVSKGLIEQYQLEIVLGLSVIVSAVAIMAMYAMLIVLKATLRFKFGQGVMEKSKVVRRKEEIRPFRMPNYLTRWWSYGIYVGILVGVAYLFFPGSDSVINQHDNQAEKSPADPYENWESNNGTGPVKTLELPAAIDQDMALKGLEIYEQKCTACHKEEKKFIGPAPKGIFERRSAAWVMNMILNPDEMVKKDPIAKKLLMEFNGSPMANQNLTEDEARAVLEYFRTL